MTGQLELSFERALGPAAATRRALFLHGILGSGSNLRAVAKRFVAARPGWEAWLVDLRGHGGSPKGTPEPSLAAAAADVLRLCAGPPAVAALVGHSFGGKVALEMVRQGLGAAWPVHVVTIDSNPGARTPRRAADSALAVLEMLEAMPAAFPSRTAFIEAVIARGKSRALAQWLAKSTAFTPAGGVEFALDLAEIRALLQSYFAADLWPVVEAPPDAVRVHLIIGDRSSSYSPADRARARQIAAHGERVSVDLLPADHWVHTDDPEGLLRVMLTHIPARRDGENP